MKNDIEPRQKYYVSFRAFSAFRLLLVMLLIPFSGFSVYEFSSTATCKDTQIVIISIWAVGPPLWFFLEYLWLDKEWVQIERKGASDKEAFLNKVKVYSDLASKVWAAILAILIVLYTEQG